MRLVEFGYIVDLYELKSFTKVAEKNFLSQSIISKLIKKLEIDFGVNLIERAKFSKSVEFTKEGLMLYEFAKKMKKEIEILEENIYQEQEETIIIGYPKELGIEYVREYLEKIFNIELIKKNNIEIIADRIDKLKDKLKRGEINFILGYSFDTILKRTDMENILLKELSFKLYGSRDNIIKINRKKKLTLDFLQNKKIISLKEGTVHYDVIEDIISNNSITAQQVLYVSEIEILYKLIGKGIAWTILSSEKIHERENMKSLKIENDKKLRIYLQYYKYKKLTNLEKKIIEKILSDD